jgi:succinate dehydrogenase/fumarate reductase flavoprotein subunit
VALDPLAKVDQWYTDPYPPVHRIFVQFHPTALPVSSHWQSKTTLMSESLRNDGRIWVPKKAGDDRPANDIPEEERDYYLERKSRYTEFLSGPTPWPLSIWVRALREATSRGVRFPHERVVAQRRPDLGAQESRR